MIDHQISNSKLNTYNAFFYSDCVWNSHFHGSYELIYCSNGTAAVTLNGVDTILEKGELLLIPPYFVHEISIDKTSKIWVGVFAKEYVQQFSKEYSQTLFNKFRCNEKIEAFLHNFLFIKDVPDKYMLKACLYLVCNECVNNASIVQLTIDPDFINRTITYISSNFLKNISLKSVAVEFGYEPHYFSSLFHKTFNMGFANFVNMFRYEYAMTMLCSKSCSMTEIALNCGFGSIRNFNRIFKNFSGQTPSDYVKNIK